MKTALISEWRKLTTVRSTFVVGGGVLFISALVAFLAYGRNAGLLQLNDPNFMHDGALSTLNFVAIFPALVAVLLVTHEYRYNTIMHTLTATRNRIYVMLAKISVVTVYAVVLTLLVVIVTVGFGVLGASVSGQQMSPQDLNLTDLLARGLMFMWGYTMLGLLMAMLIRNQVASIVTLLALPTIGEGLMTLVLKSNIKYLPFQSLSAVMKPTQGVFGSQTSAAATATVLIYIAIGAIAVAILLNRRDAN